MEPEPMKITKSAIRVARQFNVLRSMRKTAQKAIVPVSTAYKRKKDKIQPLDLPTDGQPTGGDPHFFEKCEILEKAHRHMNSHSKTAYDLWITPKFSDIPQGQCLTNDHIKSIDVGSELWPRERDLLLTLLFNREAAIAFDWHEKGLIKPEIEPPNVIRIRPGHIPWQEPPMRVP